MITREQAIQTWAARWTTLRAWRRDLSEVKVRVSDTVYPSRLGTCWPFEQRVAVYGGQDMIGSLNTLVHELAHAATIGEHHNEEWQEVYAAAVTEITGIEVVPCAYVFHEIETAAHRAMRQWWKQSGHALAWKLAGGGVP